MTPPGLAAPGLAAAGPADLLLLLSAAALVPAALMTLTAFLKIAVVLSVLRHAIGAPQVPPNGAVTGLALMLALTVMAPVAEAAIAAASEPLPAAEVGVAATLARARRAAEPLRAFLLRHARPEDRATLAEATARLRGDGSRPSPDDLSLVAPAFVLSELRRAFTVGFLVFVPFLVVDLLVANVLLALGLVQLSPTSIALPFKLLLFVAVDGWRLLARGLILSYGG